MIKPTKIKSVKIAIACTLLVMLCVGAYYFLQKKELVFDNAKLELSGTFILSPYGGKVEKILVKPFQKVEKDDILLIFDSAPFQLLFTQATANLELVRAGRKVNDFPISLELKALISLQEGKIQQARLDEDLQKKEYEYWVNEEARLLIEVRTPGKEVEDGQKQAVENAKLMKENLLIRYENASSLRVEYEKALQEIKETAYNTQKAISSEDFWFAQVQNAKEALSYIEMKAPFTGFVTSVFSQIGDNTLPHQPLIKISLLEKESFPVLVSASIEKAQQVKVGDLAYFKGNKTQFDAEVVEIVENAENFEIKLQAQSIPKVITNDVGKAIIYVK